MNNNSTNKNKNTKIKRKPRVMGKRLPNNRKRRTNVIRGRKIAAASAGNFKKKFTMLRQNGNSVRVTGRDLIYSIPDDLTAPIQDTNVITVIPANPAYWKGTRIAALASGYQNYRPITFRITYIPMCAVTQQGNVIGGTIWDDGIDNDNLQQSLRTSNGGFMTQCYVPHTTRIRPKTNLQFNLYRMGGEFSTTSNPFIFIALAIGCKNSNNQRIVPGYFYVTWSFELKNPIGSINTYNNSGLIQYQHITPEMNNVIINIDPSSDVPFGAYVNIEQEDDELKAYYNDTSIEISNTTPVWAFTSVTKTSNARSRPKIPIIYGGVTTTYVDFSTKGILGYIISSENQYDIYLINNMEPEFYYRLLQSDTVMLIYNREQNFGTIKSPVSKQVTVYQGDTEKFTSTWTFSHYIADKANYTIIISSKIKKHKIQSQLPMIQEQPESNKEEEDKDETKSTTSLIQKMDDFQI